MSAEALPGRVRRLRPGDPRRIGTYEVIGFLGEGGMGQVFVGRDRDGVLVAIKVIRAELARDPEFRARFRREADSAMAVPRFCTAEVLAADSDAAVPYLVTEYIDGPTLQEAVTGGTPLRRAELDQLAVSVATALSSIHGAGIMHRDLKPGNVLLSRLGPRVIDFGIAGAVDVTRLTAEGRTLGTPAYMAPEQLQAKPCRASDIFSWGGIVIFAATGRHPFGGGSPPAVAAQIMTAEPDLSGLNGRLRDAVAAAMSKDPAQRPTATRLLEMLGVSGAGAGEAVPSRREGGRDGPPHRAAAFTDLTRVDPAGTAGEPSAGTAEPLPATLPSPHGGPTAPSAQGMAPASAGGLPRQWQTTWTPTTTGRRGRAHGRRWTRPLLALGLSGALIGGVIAWLTWYGRPGDFAVTAVNVRVDDTRQGCDAQVDVVGTLTTNGAAGEIVYRWKRSDRKRPGPALRQSMERGRKEATVHLLWEINGTGTRTFTATLMVLNDPALQRSAAFTYSC